MLSNCFTMGMLIPFFCAKSRLSFSAEEREKFCWGPVSSLGCVSRGSRLASSKVAQCKAEGVYSRRMPAAAAEDSSVSSDSASSTSLVSRHLHSVQLQVRALQSELSALKDSELFAQDRFSNLEHITTSLSASVQGLNEQFQQLQRAQSLQAAGLQAQASAISRLARRLADLERAGF